MQESRFDSVVAILVVFDSRIDPSDVVEHLESCLGMVIVVDNTLNGHAKVNALPNSKRIVSLRNANHGGLAGAYNLALRQLELDGTDWSQVVFVDDDSDVSVLTKFLADEVTIEALSRTDTAAVSPVYRDRASGLRGSYTQLGRFGFRYLPREQRGLASVSFLINSMSVWRRAALRNIGSFDESLAVDRVDTDYCLRAKLAGMAVFINGDHEFAHSLGRRIKYSLMGVTLQSSGHSPARRFMIARNTIWVAKRHGARWPVLVPLSVLWIGYEIVGILVAESCKREKLGAIAGGVRRGLSTTPV